MSVTLVFKSLRYDENRVLVEETSANYETVEEAMLQAAHNEMVTPGLSLRIEVDGKKVAGPADFKKALKVYREARNQSLSMNDQSVVEVDSSHHLRRMKEHING